MLEYDNIKIINVSKIQRIHLSENDRASGYWSWNVRVKIQNGNACLIGSPERVKDILKHDDKLIFIAIANAVGFEIVLNKEVRNSSQP